MKNKGKKSHIKNLVIFLALLVLFIPNLNFVSAELNYTTGSEVYRSFTWNNTYINDNFTLSAWVYLKDDVENPIIWKPFGYSLLVDSDNKTKLKLNNGTEFSSSGTISLNTWTFIAASYNGTNMNIYIDTTKTSSSYSGGYFKSSDTFEILIGKDAFNYSNGTIDEVMIFNKALNENEVNLLYKSNLRKYAINKWLFYIVQTGLEIGTQYFYSLFTMDFAGNSNSTEIRIVQGNSAPTFISISHTPTSLDDIDPNVLINITVNVSDTDNNLDSAILQYKNSTSNWNNITMNNLTIKGLYTLMNANFTPDSEDNWTYRIWANDTQAESTFSSNTSLNVSWDCTWTATSDLGSIAGWAENRNIGNIIINNTGDSMFADNNCSLDFRLTYDLPEPRIYFDSAYYKPSSSYTISAGNNQNVSINATFGTEIKQEDVIITTEEVSSRSNTSSRNTTATIVSNQDGPYLYQKITSYPSSVYLTPGTFSLESYLRNLMGSPTIDENNTAYNVTFNWTLASGFTNVSGNLTTNFTNITDNELHYNNLNISFSNLASMTSGIKTFYLYVSGVNLTGSAITDADNNTLLAEQVNITFLCYGVSDSVYVTSCGSLDGDYVAPSTETTSGGGGGGSSAKVKAVSSSEELQFVRGKQDKLIVLFKNKNLESSLTNLFLEVSGKIAKYIKISPEKIDFLGPGGEINLTLTIFSPTYIDLGTQEITITITGKLGSKSYLETKRITLEIHELDGGEAKQLLEDSRGLVKQLEEVNLTYDYLINLLNQSEIEIKIFNYELVRDNYKIIENQVTVALKTNEIIGELIQLILVAEKKGINVKDSSRLLELSILSLNRREFLQSYERAMDAQMAYALEVKGEIGKMSYYLKNYPQQISLATLFIMLFGFGTYKVDEIRRIKKKIRKLKNEELILNQLIELVQKETFKEKKMSMDEYKVAIEQYQQKLSGIIEQLIKFENKRVHVLRFLSKDKKLLNEKDQLIKLVKQLQNDYLKEGKMETKSYELRLKSYDRRLTYIEESLALLEAKQAFRKGWKFWDILRVPKENRL